MIYPKIIAKLINKLLARNEVHTKYSLNKWADKFKDFPNKTDQPKEKLDPKRMKSKSNATPILEKNKVFCINAWADKFKDFPNKIDQLKKEFNPKRMRFKSNGTPILEKNEVHSILVVLKNEAAAKKFVSKNIDFDKTNETFDGKH